MEILEKIKVFLLLVRKEKETSLASKMRAASYRAPSLLNVLVSVKQGENEMFLIDLTAISGRVKDFTVYTSSSLLTGHKV